VRYRELSENRKRQIRYGAIALAVVLMAGGLIFLTHHGERTTAVAPADATGVASTDASNPRRPIAGAGTSPATASTASSQATSGDEVTVINGLRRDDAVALIGEARRQAAAGNFAAAEAQLDKAEKTMPRLAETQQARNEIARLKTPEGRFADLVLRARLAVDHDDSAAAEAALEEAAKIRADAPQIAEVRAALKSAEDKRARREARIAEALTRMREAVARRDFGAADTALNEAERIDLQDPSIRRARGDLARARGAQE
jgi:hypothetical protein